MIPEMVDSSSILLWSDGLGFGDSVQKKISKEHLPYADDFNARVNFLVKCYNHAKDYQGLVQIEKNLFLRLKEFIRST